MKKHNYKYLSRGIDIDGWMKVNLRRDDGREVSVPMKRYRQLQREGRINPDCYPISAPRLECGAQQ